MSTAISEPDSEAAILARVVVVVASLNPEAARALLALRFSKADGRRMTQRLARSRDGDLNDPGRWG